MISDKLKEIRESVGLNKKEFAKYLGLKYTTYNNYETGAREPASDFLILISEKFDISIDYLLGRKAEINIKNSYQLKSSEYAIIEKYRFLDDLGRKHIDQELEQEVTRVTIIRDQANHIDLLISQSKDYLEPAAAHGRTDIEVTDEMKKYDDDIMDDENF